MRGVEAPGTADWEAVCADARKTPPQGGVVLLGNRLRLAATSDLDAQEWSGSREIVAEVPLTGLSFGKMTRNLKTATTRTRKPPDALRMRRPLQHSVQFDQ